jgi:cyclophilin family peptidyl-prolyl cis-trans isomerase
MRKLLCWVGLAMSAAAPAASASKTADLKFNVGLNTAKGRLDTVRLELYDDRAPITVANFLNYVNNTRYDGTILHRSVPGFVMQGGGFKPVIDAMNQVTDLAPIPTFPPIQNEFSPDRSNLRGTVAMAKVGGNPNSATSQFFVNLANNASNLDTQNGGFTVFANVIGDGMTLMDAYAGLTRYNLNPYYDPNYDPANPTDGPFAQVPLLNGQSFIVLQSVTILPGPGDADGNGKVNIDDYFRIDLGFANAKTGFANGDFSGDGRVDGDDYYLIDTHFPVQGVALAASGASAVPEPTGAGMAILITSTMLAARRRRTRA